MKSECNGQEMKVGAIFFSFFKLAFIVSFCGTAK